MTEPSKGLVRYLLDELGQTFRSLRHRNYRLYSLGQLVSLTGTWMQSIALQWLTYSLTHSAWMLGLIGLFSNLPVLLFSLPAGAVADRLDRRRVLIATQWVDLTLAAVLTGLAAAGCLHVWMIFVIAFLQGTCTAFEMPCRQAIVPDLVQGTDLVNALSLNSVILNFSRMVGPALGAIVLGVYGAAACFGLDAASYLAAIVTLSVLRLDKKPVDPSKPVSSGVVSMKEGLTAALGNSDIRNVFVLTFFTAFFGFQFSILLPVFVKDVFKEAAFSLGWLTSATAVGSLAASLFFASRGKPETLKRMLKFAAVGVSITLLALAASTSLAVALIVLVLTGIAFSLQFNGCNSLLQLSVTDALRGRVMSLYSMIVLGSAPLGSLVIGLVSDTYGAPFAVAICGLACGIGALFYITRK